MQAHLERWRGKAQKNKPKKKKQRWSSSHIQLTEAYTNPCGIGPGLSYAELISSWMHKIVLWAQNFFSWGHFSWIKGPVPGDQWQWVSGLQWRWKKSPWLTCLWAQHTAFCMRCDWVWVLCMLAPRSQYAKQKGCMCVWSIKQLLSAKCMWYVSVRLGECVAAMGGMVGKIIYLLESQNHGMS